VGKTKCVSAEAYLSGTLVVAPKLLSSSSLCRSNVYLPFTASRPKLLSRLQSSSHSQTTTSHLQLHLRSNPPPSLRHVMPKLVTSFFPSHTLRPFDHIRLRRAQTSCQNFHHIASENFTSLPRAQTVVFSSLHHARTGVSSLLRHPSVSQTFVTFDSHLLFGTSNSKFDLGFANFCARTTVSSMRRAQTILHRRQNVVSSSTLHAQIHCLMFTTLHPKPSSHPRHVTNPLPLAALHRIPDFFCALRYVTSKLLFHHLVALRTLVGFTASRPTFCLISTALCPKYVSSSSCRTPNFCFLNHCAAPNVFSLSFTGSRLNFYFPLHRVSCPNFCTLLFTTSRPTFISSSPRRTTFVPYSLHCTTNFCFRFTAARSKILSPRIQTLIHS
jgi:hypothetical protein